MVSVGSVGGVGRVGRKRHLETKIYSTVLAVSVYYNKGKLRVEISPLGHKYGRDHAVILTAINLFATTKNININCIDNCTYRKTGFREAQPDISYYVGENANVVPWEASIY